MAHYNYRPLGRSTFRVLQLDPGEPNDPLICSLEETELGRIAIYEAISYVWGSDVTPEHVVCEGKILPITISLYTALQALRLVNQPRIIWADAICINQADPEERASQVLIMRQVYEGAIKVSIWLGPKSDLMERAFSLIETFTETLCDLHEEFGWHWTTEFRYAVAKRASQDLTMENREALSHFFENPWFLRAWVFQEAVCAKDAIVQSGDLEMDFKLLSLFAAFISVSEINTVLPGTCRESHHQLEVLRNVRTKYARGDRYSLFRLLISSGGAHAKDPRDQLFSLMGIAAGDSLPYPPDYKRDVILWYRDFAFHVMRSEQSLAMLSQCYLDPKRMSGLPSWAIDWTCSRYLPFESNQAARVFDADSPRKLRDIKMDGNSLILDGFLLERVTMMGGIKNPKYICSLDGLRDETRKQKAHFTVSLIEESLNIAQRSSIYTTPTALWEAFWRTLVGELDWRLKRVGSDFSELMAHLKPIVLSGGKLGDEIVEEQSVQREEVDIAIKRVIHCRRFCLTEKGRIGWIPQVAKEGDVLALLIGAGVPMLLRPVAEQYQVVGSCYIHGIMDGEIMAMKEQELAQQISLC